MPTRLQPRQPRRDMVAMSPMAEPEIPLVLKWLLLAALIAFILLPATSSLWMERPLPMIP